MVDLQFKIQTVVMWALIFSSMYGWWKESNYRDEIKELQREVRSFESDNEDREDRALYEKEKKHKEQGTSLRILEDRTHVILMGQYNSITDEQIVNYLFLNRKTVPEGIILLGVNKGEIERMGTYTVKP